MMMKTNLSLLNKHGLRMIMPDAIELMVKLGWITTALKHDDAYSFIYARKALGDELVNHGI